MLLLRLSVPPNRAAEVTAALERERGVTGISRHREVVVATGEDEVTAWVREASVDEVLAALRSLGVVRRGSLTLAREQVIVPGPLPWSIPQLDPGAQVVVWEEVEGHAGSTARLTPRYVALMGIAGLIAAVGILESSPVPIVGAMAVSPDLLPLVSIAYGLATRRPRIAALAVATLAAGLLACVVLAGAIGAIADVFDLADDAASDRAFLVGFVITPSVLGALVALAAGVAGMLSFQTQQGGAAVGVAISITTIPAAAAIGVALVQGEWSDLLGAVSVLGANLTCVAIGGTATVLVQRHAESRDRGT
ncbi:MAG TPA: DUF389 domain-containing protein [Actinomycetota bacterium]|nr:DUF389 domain-containing protein [Actinomycetota bacterium]